MRDVIDYLENVGCHSDHGSGSQPQPMLEKLLPAARAAIARGDAEALRRALGLTLVMACMISVPSDDEDGFEEQPASPDESPEETETKAA